MIKKLLAAGFLLLMISSCKQDLPVEKFDDIIVRHTYTSKFGSAVGFKALYLIYGKNYGLVEGTAISPTHRFYFRIKEVLDKYPELESKEALLAELRQEKKYGK